jgi:hypothetical protein
MGLLNNSTVYLSGAVEAHQDPNSWRNQLSIKLKELGIKAYNPLIKPFWVPQIDGHTQASWKSVLTNPMTMNAECDTIWYTNGEIRQFCLHLAATANFMIVKIDKTFTVGTFEEIGLAKYKPVFIISDGISSMWLLDQLGLTQEILNEYIFKSVDDLVNQLKLIDAGRQMLPRNKWLFMTYGGPNV